MQMPRKGLLAAAAMTAGRRPRQSSSRMQSGIAPWPGNTTRSAAATRAFEADPAGVTAYGTSVGYLPLRKWIADKHGVAPDRVLVTNGSLQADALLFEHAINWSIPKPYWAKPGEVGLVADPFLAPMTLRYTPPRAADPLPLVLSAVDRLVKRLVDARKATPAAAGAAGPGR